MSKSHIILVGIVSLVIFAITAGLVITTNSWFFDDPIRFWVYSKRNSCLNSILIPITYMGNWQTITSLIVLLVVIPKTRKNIGLPMAATSVCSLIIYKIAKSLIARPRPDLMYRLITQGGYSFPSGHSMNGLVCYGILIYLIYKTYGKNKKTTIISWILGILIVLIGLSRVYVGVHFPTDIIGGWSFGAFVLCGAILTMERFEEKGRLK